MEKSQTELKYCFTAYADILGYSEMIQRCNNDYNLLLKELEKIKANLIEPQDFLIKANSHFDGRTVKFFSDSVFVNVPMRSDSPTTFRDGRPEIGNSLDDLASYQFNLALNGYFIRGCATVNYAYFDESIVFGPGILEVVKCEKNAQYPRICLTKGLVKITQYYYEKNWPGHESISSYIYRDSENRYFLNYLQVVNDYIDNCCDGIPDDVKEYPLYKNIPDSVEMMNTHKENIEKNLKDNTPDDIKKKYVWLAHYHNFFCRNHFWGCEKLIIEGYNNEFIHF